MVLFPFRALLLCYFSKLGVKIQGKRSFFLLGITKGYMFVLSCCSITEYSPIAGGSGCSRNLLLCVYWRTSTHGDNSEVSPGPQHFSFLSLLLYQGLQGNLQISFHIHSATLSLPTSFLRGKQILLYSRCLCTSACSSAAQAFVLAAGSDIFTLGTPETQAGYGVCRFLTPSLTMYFLACFSTFLISGGELRKRKRKGN